MHRPEKVLQIMPSDKTPRLIILQWSQAVEGSKNNNALSMKALKGKKKLCNMD